MFANTHPIIVHFPIALLCILPIFLALPLIFKNSARTFYISAAILLVIGSLGLFLAAASGEQASEMIEKSQITKDALKTLNEHYEGGELARNIYAIFCVVFILFLNVGHRLPNKFKTILSIIFLLSSLGLLPLLMETAHRGGELVHEHAIHSKLFETQP